METAMEMGSGFYFKISGRTLFLNTSNYYQLFEFLISWNNFENYSISHYTVIITAPSQEKIKFITDNSFKINHFQNEFYLSQYGIDFFKLEFNNFNEPYKVEFSLNGKI